MMSFKETYVVVACYVLVVCVGVIIGNEYVFDNHDFSTLFNNQQGHFKVLKKFSERSELFKSIENIRMLNLEVNPYGFVIPHHWDSDVLFFVGQGRGTITLVFMKGTQSFNIQKGHLMTIPAGITFYLINGDDNEKLILSGFVKTIADTGGNVLLFFSVGGQNPESFYYGFSPEVLESVFNTSSDRLQKVFSKQGNGAIVKASKEQIKALTVEEDTPLPHGNSYCLEQYGPCQLLYYPAVSVECGHMFMVTHSTYLELQALDMYISLSHTAQGCMNYPFHSTRAMKVTAVVKGRGSYEVSTPDYDVDSNRIHYKKVTSELSQGMMFVTPPGHQLILMAAPDEDLLTVNFEFHAKGNERDPFGGSDNVLRNLQKEAKELTFATSAEEVDEVLNTQTSSFFLRSPIKLQNQNTASF